MAITQGIRDQPLSKDFFEGDVIFRTTDRSRSRIPTSPVIRSAEAVSDGRSLEPAAGETPERRGGFGAGAVLVGTKWPAADRTAQRGPRTVTLRGLGMVHSEGRRGTASYNALLAAHVDGVEIEIGGHRITLRLTREGILLEAGSAAVRQPAQLALLFGDDLGQPDGNA